MFTQQKPEAVSDPLDILCAFAALTPEELQLRCDQYSTEQLDESINLLDKQLALLDKIENMFQYTVGYPSREAAINGISAYATGKVRESQKELEKSLNDFTKMFPGRNTYKAPEKSAEEIKKNEELMKTLEDTAKRYLRIKNVKPQLEENLGTLRLAFAKKGGTNAPEKAPEEAPEQNQRCSMM